MNIGVPREIKNHEARVSLIPAGVRTLVEEGHKVVVETSASEGSGIPDEEYLAAGAIIRQSPADIYKEAELIVKVKEPLPEEYNLLRGEVRSFHEANTPFQSILAFRKNLLTFGLASGEHINAVSVLGSIGTHLSACTAAP